MLNSRLTDALLSAEIGKGWKSEAERQAYLDKCGDDDHLPAIFCSTEEELKNSPDVDAFSDLLMDNEVSARRAHKFDFSLEYATGAHIPDTR